MPTTEYKPFATGLGNEVTDQSTYSSAAWRSKGYGSGRLGHEMLNKVLRQCSMVAAAVTQVIADVTGKDVEDDGDLQALVDRLGAALSGAIPFDPDGDYVVGTFPYALQSILNNGLSFYDAPRLLQILTESVSEDELSPALRNRINLIDADTTGLVDQVAALLSTYGSTAAAAQSKDQALAAVIDAQAARDSAAVSEANAHNYALAAGVAASTARAYADKITDNVQAAILYALSADPDLTTTARAGSVRVEKGMTITDPKPVELMRAEFDATGLETFATLSLRYAYEKQPAAGQWMLELEVRLKDEVVDSVLVQVPASAPTEFAEYSIPLSIARERGGPLTITASCSTTGSNFSVLPGSFIAYQTFRR